MDGMNDPLYDIELDGVPPPYAPPPGRGLEGLPLWLVLMATMIVVQFIRSIFARF
jgi:hypothetical protein